LRVSGTKAGRLSVTECCVLGLLADREQSGYDLNKFAQRSVGLIYAPAKSRIYAVLPRLLERGFVRRRAIAQERRPDKHIYRITAAGRASLADWLNDTSRPQSRPLLLLKVFFGAEADPDALAEQLRNRREQVAAELEMLEEIESTLIPARESTFFQLLTVDWGLAIDPVEVKWIDRTLRRLASHSRTTADRAVERAR
jgi:DNA-binding PadR family transcriptional regulator